MKTVDIDPQKNYLLACHPHGVLCTGTFICINSTCTGIHKLFPGLDARLTMLPVWFKIPFMRDYLMAGGRSISFVRYNQAIDNELFAIF